MKDASGSNLPVQPRSLRELRTHFEQSGNEWRFNPAHAGNSSNMRRISLCLSVQPRSRGELTISGQFVFDKNGSTPLARGTQHRNTREYFYERFNPACAGNSASEHKGIFLRAVQPRLRGELFLYAQLNSEKVGSTPLARGTPFNIRSSH